MIRYHFQGTTTAMVLGLCSLPCAAAEHPQRGRVANGLIAYADVPGGQPGPQARFRAHIYTVRPDGTDRRRLTTGPAGNFWPAWSPDGRQLAFVSVRNGQPEIWLADADGRNERRLTTGLLAAWAPAGDRIAFARPDARRRPQIRVIGTDGKGERQLTTEGANHVPTWSPTGDRLAFFRAGARRASGHVWVMGSDGSDPKQLTFPVTDDYTPSGSSANAPAWSSSDRIAYWSGIERRYGQIWTMNADGSGKRRVTNETAPITSDNPAWSPDGTKILFDTQRRGRPEIWVMDADGSNPHVLVADVKMIPARASWQPVHKRSSLEE